MISAQIRCGRAVLNLSQGDFANLCGLTRTTVTKAEECTDGTRAKTLTVIFKTLKKHGVTFKIVGNSFQMKYDL